MRETILKAVMLVCSMRGVDIASACDWIIDVCSYNYPWWCMAIATVDNTISNNYIYKFIYSNI